MTSLRLSQSTAEDSLRSETTEKPKGDYDLAILTASISALFLMSETTEKPKGDYDYEKISLPFSKREA